MKKSLLNFALLFLSLSCICGMCSKEEDYVTPVDEKMVGKFKITEYTKISNGVSTNYFAILPACVKDNIISYGRDYVVSIDEGASKCNAADPQFVSAKFSIDGTKIITYTGDEGDDLDEGTFIDVFASGDMRLSFEGGTPGDKSIIYYKKQP